MNRLRKDTKIGLIHFMAYPEVMKGEGPVLETLGAILADDYFDVVEVTRIKDDGVAKEAAKLIDQAHATVAFGAQPVLLMGKGNLNAEERGERRNAVEAVAECFDQAAMLGAVGVAVLAGPWEQGKEQSAKEALIESLVELSGGADKHGMKLVLEIFDDAVEKRALVGKAAVAREVGQAVRKECANFGLMHDLSHMPLLGESPGQALEPIKELLVHMHMGNAILKDKTHAGYGDQHPRFGIAQGENDVDQLTDFLRTLYEIGYLGGGERRILSFEVKPLAGESSEMVIAGAKRVLNEAASRL